MSAVDCLLNRRPLIEAAVGEQLRELTKNGLFLNGVKVPKKINAKCLQQLLEELRNINAGIRDAYDARNQMLETHCCFRIKASSCCGRNEEKRWTANLLKLQGSALIIGLGAIGVNIIVKTACDGSANVITSGVGLIAMAVAGIASIVIGYDQKKIKAAEYATASIVENVEPSKKAGFIVCFFLLALEEFREKPNHSTLSECVKMWKALPVAERNELPQYKKMLGKLIYCLPDDDECKLLVHELFRIAAARSQGKTQLYHRLDCSKAVISSVEFIHSDETSSHSPEEEDKELVEDLIIEPKQDTQLLEEYKIKWAKLEELLGFKVDKLQCKGIYYNKLGEWWINLPSEEERKVANNADISEKNLVADDDSNKFRISIPPLPPLENSFLLPILAKKEASNQSRTLSCQPNQTSPNPSPRLKCSTKSAPLPQTNSTISPRSEIHLLIPKEQ